MHGTGSYRNFCNYFIAREIEHIEDQAILDQEEIANSAVTYVELEELKYEMVNLSTKNSELKDTLVTITGAMEQQKKIASVVMS